MNTTFFFFFKKKLVFEANCFLLPASIATQLKTKRNTNAPKRSLENAAPRSRCGPQGRRLKKEPSAHLMARPHRESLQKAASKRPNLSPQPPHPLQAQLCTPQHNPSQLFYPPAYKGTAAHPTGPAHHAPARPQHPLDLTNALHNTHSGPEVTHH